MKKRRFFIGPGAPSLMLAVVVVGMSVLGLLALMSARNDARLAQRTGDFTAAQYEAMAASERTLAELDAILARCAENAQGEDAYLAAIAQALPQTVKMAGRQISWTESGQEGPALRCTAEVLPLGNQQTRLRWVEHLFTGSDMFFE